MHRVSRFSNVGAAELSHVSTTLITRMVVTESRARKPGEEHHPAEKNFSLVLRRIAECLNGAGGAHPAACNLVFAHHASCFCHVVQT